MRESYGATWLTQIVIVFILLFAAIICYAVNYGKAFKIKNQIVEDLEYYESPKEAKEAIKSYLVDVGYRKTSTLKLNEEDNGQCQGYGLDAEASTDTHGEAYYFICKYNSSVNTSDINKVYYKVYVFWGFDLPVIGGLLNFKIVGTTKSLPSVGEDWR